MTTLDLPRQSHWTRVLNSSSTVEQNSTHDRVVFVSRNAQSFSASKFPKKKKGSRKRLKHGSLHLLAVHSLLINALGSQSSIEPRYCGLVATVATRVAPSLGPARWHSYRHSLHGPAGFLPSLSRQRALVAKPCKQGVNLAPHIGDTKSHGRARHPHSLA